MMSFEFRPATMEDVLSILADPSDATVLDLKAMNHSPSKCLAFFEQRVPEADSVALDDMRSGKVVSVLGWDKRPAAWHSWLLTSSESISKERSAEMLPAVDDMGNRMTVVNGWDKTPAAWYSWLLTAPEAISKDRSIETFAAQHLVEVQAANPLVELRCVTTSDTGLVRRWMTRLGFVPMAGERRWILQVDRITEPSVSSDSACGPRPLSNGQAVGRPFPIPT